MSDTSEGGGDARAFVYGLIGGMIGGALVGAVLLSYASPARAAPQDERQREAAHLMRELDAYFQWRRAAPDGYLPANRWGTGTVESYERFLAQHRAFEAYFAWTIDTRLREMTGRGSRDYYEANNPGEAVMRDPAWINRYLNEKSRP